MKKVKESEKETEGTVRGKVKGSVRGKRLRNETGKKGKGNKTKRREKAINK